MEDKVFCPLMGEEIDVAICFDTVSYTHLTLPTNSRV